jgi:ABC-type Fe3+/spermidine/putrescine transport system ATPase subunit
MRGATDKLTVGHGGVAFVAAPDPERALLGGLLELDGLTRRFGAVTALDGLSFCVPSGEVVGFLGPNGAGKTTAMRAIFGLTDLDVGSVRWNGAPVGPAERRRFGYMPEERGWYPSMLVAEETGIGTVALARQSRLSPSRSCSPGR